MMDLAASEVKGMRVVNAADEELGTMEEIYLDLLQGRVILATFKFKDKIFPVPLAALSFRPYDKVFVLHVDRQTLETAPGYKGKFKLGGRSKQEEVFSHYGYAPYWE